MCKAAIISELSKIVEVLSMLRLPSVYREPTLSTLKYHCRNGRIDEGTSYLKCFLQQPPSQLQSFFALHVVTGLLHIPLRFYLAMVAHSAINFMVLTLALRDIG